MSSLASGWRSAIRRTKQQVIDEITALIAAEPLTVSRGSTEPKAVFDAVNSRLELGIDPTLSKPRYAEAICRAAGVPWDQLCDSRHSPSGGGSTVTMVGLERVLSATKVLVDARRRAAFSKGVLPDDTPLEVEARRILQVLDAHLPRHVDGRAAVLALREAGRGWRHIEWPGFYFEHFGREALQRHLGGDVGPRFGNTEFDYRLIRVFDIKVHTSGSEMWLNDAEAMETAILRSGGIGFIIISGFATPDHDGSFRRWHEDLKGGPSPYSLEREARGAPSRKRKVDFTRTGLEIVHLAGIDDLRDGVENRWLRLSSQGRQSGGGRRRPKYQLTLSRAPERLRHRL